MLDRLDPLSAAVKAAGAPGDRFTLCPDHIRAAYRAMLRHFRRGGIALPKLQDHPRDLGYDVASTANDDGISDPNIFPSQFIEVMQCRVTHGNATDEYR